MNTKPITYKRRNLNVSDADYSWFKAIGKGNASAGLREARRRVESQHNDRGQGE